jgi:hypothetical protein
MVVMALAIPTPLLHPHLITLILLMLHIIILMVQCMELEVERVWEGQRSAIPHTERRTVGILIHLMVDTVGLKKVMDVVDKDRMSQFPLLKLSNCC